MKSLCLFLVMGIGISAWADVAPLRLPPTRPGAVRTSVVPAANASTVESTHAAPTGTKARAKKHAGKKHRKRAHKRHAR